MQEQILTKYISTERLISYTTKYAKSISSNSLSLYQWNTEISESLYPLLQTIEVALRNALHSSISAYFNDHNWLTNKQLLEYNEVKRVAQAIEQLDKIKCNYKTGDLIAELSFGFWISLLDRRYEQTLWPKLIKACFPCIPKKNRNPRYISVRFNKIRKLRNRVFHYEPIWHWKDLLQQYHQLIEIITWFDPTLLKLVSNNRFIKIYGAKSKLKQKSQEELIID